MEVINRHIYKECYKRMPFDGKLWQAYVKKLMNIWVPNKWETLRLCAMEFFI